MGKMALDRVQTTYQTQLLNSEVQVQDTATIIKKMKDEKKVVEDSIKLGMEQILMIVTAWKNWTKANIDDYSMTVWTQRSQQAASKCKESEKTGDNFYKLDEESSHHPGGIVGRLLLLG